MYKTCPKCGYQRQAVDPEPYTQCPGCGLIFAKWMRHLYRQAARPDTLGKTDDSDFPRRLKILLFEADTPLSQPAFYGRAALCLGFLVWGIQFLLMDHRLLIGGLPEINGSFLHLVNLVFHEAGHVLFRPFGGFMATLGGSLTQLIMRHR